MFEGLLGRIAAVGVAAAILLSLLFAFLAEATTQLICGTRPTPTSLFSGLWLALTGDPAAYTGPAGCALPVWQIRVLDLVAVLLVVAVAVWALAAYRRYRHSDQSFLADLRLRPGFAPASEIRDHLSAKAVLRRATQLRPDLAKPGPSDVGWRVGRSRGMDVYVSIEDSVALEGPPRSG